ncbi:uncharacterized protein SCHCODRAFT_02613772 [Schizophyllum commune H4-8]|uniref:uncharacterized protein n=1 Tax=Schizophyllum commune (strain H4-8 / FGSC 9210) TaxID=578458 RepID=UPI00215EB062|nr:uncharacterized protein SCHCODRAFT_02613772 [Schizophyllum commune H4-8]KAI5896003.1 hypothetical protein SCHCODRAFT_02613772 [Schizophyllum commune H4-8]
MSRRGHGHELVGRFAVELGEVRPADATGEGAVRPDGPPEASAASSSSSSTPSSARVYGGGRRAADRPGTRDGRARKQVRAMKRVRAIGGCEQIDMVDRGGGTC